MEDWPVDIFLADIWPVDIWPLTFLGGRTIFFTCLFIGTLLYARYN